MSKPIRLFNLDLHVSVIEDFRAICNFIFGDGIEITNWSLSFHNFVFKKPNLDVKGVNQKTWSKFSEELIEEFQKAYDDELKTYDGFVVTHTPVFAMLFEKYNKPIICINSCRFDQPFCSEENKEMMDKFSASLHRMVIKQQLTIISNNHSDEMYLFKKTGLASTVIPSLCFYTNAPYQPTKPQFVCFGDRSIIPANPLLIERPKTGFSWQDLHSYKGIVHLPYEMSTMSIFEQFWAGVPLFFPTREFYKDCLFDGKLSLRSNYDNNPSYTEEEVNFWLNTSDIYRLPFIQYFSSFEDLFEKLLTFEDPEKEQRLEWIQSQFVLHLERWKAILQKVF